MSCREFAEFLYAWFEDELAAAEAGTVRGHLQACPHCRHYLSGYRSTCELCRALADTGGPEDFPEALVFAVLAAHRSGTRPTGA